MPSVTTIAKLLRWVGGTVALAIVFLFSFALLVRWCLESASRLKPITSVARFEADFGVRLPNIRYYRGYTQHAKDNLGWLSFGIPTNSIPVLLQANDFPENDHRLPTEDDVKNFIWHENNFAKAAGIEDWIPFHANAFGIFECERNDQTILLIVFNGPTGRENELEVFMRVNGVHMRSAGSPTHGR